MSNAAKKVARRAGAVLLCGVLAACPRAEPPEQVDPDQVQPPPPAQFPPVDAPGDTLPRPPMEPVQPVVPGARPPQQRQPTPPPGQPAEPSPPQAETVRGRVVLVGAAPMSGVVIRRAAQPDITLHGDAGVVRGLRSVQGTEVEVHGHRDGSTMHVERFQVRAMDGVAVTDGIARREGDAWFVETADGRRQRVAHMPEPLRRDGQRVWIAGALDGEPEAFGIIEG